MRRVALENVIKRERFLWVTCHISSKLALPQTYKLAWPRKKNFLASICHAITDPGSRKYGYGLLLGCRSPLDAGREKTTFFYAFPPQKTVESSFDGRARHRNRSGVVELVGREPLIKVAK